MLAVERMEASGLSGVTSVQNTGVMNHGVWWPGSEGRGVVVERRDRKSCGVVCYGKNVI